MDRATRNELTDEHTPAPQLGKPRADGADVPAHAFRLLSAGEFVQGFVAPDFLVDDLIQRSYLYSLTGRTGDGKTAISVALAVSVATGVAFGDRTVEKGRVVFFAGENADDVRARVIMTCEALGENLQGLDVYFYDRPFDIVETADRLRAEITRIGGAKLVIIDTLAAFFTGDQENDNVQLGRFARDLRGLCQMPGGPCVVACAHPTKGASVKSSLVPRGGGAFLAEVDGNLTAWSEDKATTELHWTGKLRGPGFEPLNFRLDKRTSEAVKDSKDRLIGNVVAVPMSEEDIQEAGRAARRNEDCVLDMLLNRPNDSYANWCRALGWINDKDQPNKSRVARVMQKLEHHGLVKGGRTGYALTDQGRKEAEDATILGAKT